jgi:hypothetical protein
MTDRATSPTTVPPRVASLMTDVRTAIERKPQATDRLVGLHLYGSFLWGGYDDRTSDVDLVAVVADAAHLMDSYEQVRWLGLALTPRFHADISTTPLGQVHRPVPCRPYILRAAADHGRLIYGRDVLPRGGPLDPDELLTAIDFDLRQLSRNFAGLNDPCWAGIIQKDVRAHFVRLSQLMHSHRPEVPFEGGYRAALAQASELFPTVRRLPVDIALDAEGPPDDAALMVTLTGLRQLVAGPDLVAAGVAATAGGQLEQG